MKKQTPLPLRPVSMSVSAFTLAAALAVTAQTVPTMPVVTVRAPDPYASEAGDQGRFVLRRDGPTNLALNVYCVLGGTASNGVDYVTIPNWIAVPAGVSEVPIPVVPINDAVVEAPETVVLKLVPSPLLPPVNYIIGSPSNAVVTIYDNDPPPANQPPTVSITAPTDGTKFTAPANILICPDARDTDGYVATVEFFANNLSLGIRTNLCPLCLSPVNPFCLTWSNAPPGDYVLTAKATDDKGAMGWSNPVQISVNPPPPPVVTIRATDPNASEPGVLTVIDPGVFVITRTGETNRSLPVHYAISGTAGNGADYALISNSVVIPPGRSSVELVINPLHDTLPEGTETVVITLAPIACIAIYPPPPECYQVGTPREAVVYIADNDQPTNHPPEAKISRPLDGQMFVAPVNVPIRAETVDPDGYVDHVEFYAGTNQIGEQTRYYFTPPPPGQPAVFEMVWTNAPLGRHELRVKARDDQDAMGWSLPVTIWVVNTNLPPPPPIVTITSPDPVASEGTNCIQWLGWSSPLPTNCCFANTATFVMRRSGPASDALTVHYRIGGTASNGVDYVALPGMMTIPAGRRAAEFKLVPIDDALPERIETVVLGLRVPPDTTSNVPPYIVGCPSRAAAVIVDNDQPRPATGSLPDRCFHLMKPGANGTWWRIECSTDMLHWTPICTSPVTDGAIHFVDPDADELPARFYRAVSEANPPVDLP
ncbi:MAG: Ig-like domain-containing protein [Verrucomicrobia bacterium]|jgi:hypothetical protein|nr:Ig-like domain-containing protein [Verrucomicrobiota bacterium]